MSGGARGRPASPLPARDGSGQASARVRPRLRYSSLRSPSPRIGAAACPAPRLLRSIPAAALLQAVLLSPHQILHTQRLCPQDLDLLALFLLEPLPSSNIPAEVFLQRSTVDSILGGVAAPTPPKPLWKAVALLPQRAAQLQLVQVQIFCVPSPTHKWTCQQEQRRCRKGSGLSSLDAITLILHAVSLDDDGAKEATSEHQSFAKFIAVRCFHN
ncbi:uncharacterized protein LOC120648358 isoform X1 [Panicum virgatum]|uniref:uncharacterized protein LOC120648358 isoform X1 n=1 Tax=Panicum virgatum TaxID=38727 RepID=UPI0019D5CCCC|nr:uncharacterized protein LOC120648358 isoform X1 [Panicum virgatum]